MIKILDVHYPPITYLPFTAAVLSISCNENNFNNWFYSNFIQIYNEYYGNCKDFYFPRNIRFGTPFIEYCRFNHPYMLKHDINIIDFIRSMVEQDYSLIFKIDVFHIPNYSSYQK